MRAGRSPGKLAAFVVSLLALPLLTIAPAPAQKRGGTLKLYHNDTPPSASRAPNAICEIVPSGAQVNLMVNRVNPPFDNPDIRKAMSLALDRKPFNTILMEGQGRPGMTGDWAYDCDCDCHWPGRAACSTLTATVSVSAPPP